MELGKIEGKDVVICVMDSGFLMGSMGTVVGEKITYAIEKAIELKYPIIIFAAECLPLLINHQRNGCYNKPQE